MKRIEKGWSNMIQIDTVAWNIFKLDRLGDMMHIFSHFVPTVDLDSVSWVGARCFCVGLVLLWFCRVCSWKTAKQP